MGTLGPLVLSEAKASYIYKVAPKVPLPGLHPSIIRTCFIIYFLRRHGLSKSKNLAHAYGVFGKYRLLSAKRTASPRQDARVNGIQYCKGAFRAERTDQPPPYGEFLFPWHK